MPVCIKCRVDKPTDEFYPQTGRGTRRTDCKVCNSAAASERKKRLYRLDPEKHKTWSREWKLRNTDRWSAYVKQWYKEQRELTNRWHREYAKKHPEKFAMKTMRRKARKLQATPIWANEFFIEEAYDLAKRRTKLTGFKWHVDHIVPLRHKFVCGLHCENNLQVVPASYNCGKSNNFEPGMEIVTWLNVPCTRLAASLT